MSRIAPENESDQATSSNLNATINQVTNAILAQVSTMVRQQTGASNNCTQSLNQDEVGAHSFSSAVSRLPSLVSCGIYWRKKILKSNKNK